MLFKNKNIINYDYKFFQPNFGQKICKELNKNIHLFHLFSKIKAKKLNINQHIMNL